MKSFILIMVMMSLFSISRAQTIQYFYDDAGNRIQRKVGLCKTNTTTIDDTTAFYDSDSSINDEQLQKKNELYKVKIGDVQINLFPIPTKGKLTVELADFENSSTSKMVVNDLSGKIIYEMNNLSKSNVVDFSSHSDGIYIIRIIFNNTLKERKVIKY